MLERVILNCYFLPVVINRQKITFLFVCGCIYYYIYIQSSSSQSLPADYHPPTSVATTTNTRLHPHHPTSTHHKSFLHSSEVVPLASSTLLKLSPPSLSGSTSSLNSIKSTKSAQEFSRFPSKPNISGYPSYVHTDSWSTKHSGLTSTPKSKPYRATTSVYQPRLSSSSYLSLSSYPHLRQRQPSLGDTSALGTMTAGSKPPFLKRAESASSSYKTNKKKQPSLSVGEGGGRGGSGRRGIGRTGTTSDNTTDGKFFFCTHET